MWKKTEHGSLAGVGFGFTLYQQIPCAIKSKQENSDLPQVAPKGSVRPEAKEYQKAFFREPVE